MADNQILSLQSPLIALGMLGRPGLCHLEKDGRVLAWTIQGISIPTRGSWNWSCVDVPLESRASKTSAPPWEVSPKRGTLQDFGRGPHMQIPQSPSEVVVTWRGRNYSKRVRETQKAWAAVQAWRIQSRKNVMTPAPRQPCISPLTHQHLFQTDYLFSWWLCLDARFPMSFRMNAYLPLKVLFWEHFLFSSFLLSKREKERKNSSFD